MTITLTTSKAPPVRLILFLFTVCLWNVFKGDGIGGPHTYYGWIWPMAIMSRAYTSQNDSEIIGLPFFQSFNWRLYKLLI
jgi:hypothetical protein